MYFSLWFFSCGYSIFMKTKIYFLIYEENNWRDFPAGPVVETLSSQCRGPRFDPWSGNWIPRAAAKT